MTLLSDIGTAEKRVFNPTLGENVARDGTYGLDEPHNPSKNYHLGTRDLGGDFVDWVGDRAFPAIKKAGRALVCWFVELSSPLPPEPVDIKQGGPSQHAAMLTTARQMEEAVRQMNAGQRSELPLPPATPEA